MSLGWKVWQATQEVYKIEYQAPTDPKELSEYQSNSKALNAILSGLTNTIFTKFMRCKTTKQAQDKLNIIYEGESKVKESKLQTYRGKFENLKIKEEENLGEYFLKIDEVVNSIRGPAGNLKEKEVVKKVLRTLPMKYDSKISTIEERDDLDLLTMDQLHGILTAYEMRMGQNNISKGEVTFKVTMKIKNQNENTQIDHNEEHDVEEANFIKKLQKGLGKYKSKLPFKCFNCGKIGHFQSKCPYPKKDYEDEDDKSKQYKKKGKFDYKKKYKKN